MPVLHPGDTRGRRPCGRQAQRGGVGAAGGQVDHLPVARACRRTVKQYPPTAVDRRGEPDAVWFQCQAQAARLHVGLLARPQRVEGGRLRCGRQGGEVALLVVGAAVRHQFRRQGAADGFHVQPDRPTRVNGAGDQSMRIGCTEMPCGQRGRRPHPRATVLIGAEAQCGGGSGGSDRLRQCKALQPSRCRGDVPVTWKAESLEVGAVRLIEDGGRRRVGSPEHDVGAGEPDEDGLGGGHAASVGFAALSRACNRRRAQWRPQQGSSLLPRCSKARSLPGFVLSGISQRGRVRARRGGYASVGPPRPVRRAGSPGRNRSPAAAAAVAGRAFRRPRRRP